MHSPAHPLCRRLLNGVAAFMVMITAPNVVGGVTNQAIVIEKQGVVEARFATTNAWIPAQTNLALRVDDRIRTGERSRATLHLLDQSTLRMAELTEFLIEPLADLPDKPSFSLTHGLLYFFHRDKPADVKFKTRSATAAIRGTEFHLAVEADDRTVITMFDGEVQLSNDYGSVQLRNGEQGIATPGRPPVKSPVIDAVSVIQWCLYYPGALDTDELTLDAAGRTALQPALDAYRAGDLRAALDSYPQNRQPGSDSEKTFLAALLLGVGKAAEAERILTAVDTRQAAALRELIATVKNLPATNTLASDSATAELVRSYRLQSKGNIRDALAAAERSVSLSPEFGFGWARVAELEFGLGHTKAAQTALDKALALSPRNAQAVALRGFTFAAQNHIGKAAGEFDRAIALDGALGNAWLGRGLCKIRRGDLHGGRADLQVAAALEPNRALLRSYLAKAWAETGDSKHAEQELALAKERDSNDPTAWLYSALLLQEQNRINEAVDELERSKELNDNRRVYRSQLLLDQDRAVRGANLANIYRDAGMTDVSIREAATAVNADYANYSAHLFLANSYFAQRDLTGVNLRYETPFVSEYLVASLLAPVGASALSQQISQQEYSRLFERDGFGFSSSTEYYSEGSWRQTAAQEFISGNTSIALDQYYNTQNGQRPNNDQEVTEFSLRWKQQLTPADSLFFQITRGESEGGNLAQYYNQSDATNAPFRFKEKQSPIFIVGYHHEWSPGSHTLFLGSRLQDSYSYTNPLAPVFQTAEDFITGEVQEVMPMVMRQHYRSRLEIYTAEIQQILASYSFTTIVGARYQNGEFRSENTQINFDLGQSDLFPDPITQRTSPIFERMSVYGYEHWQMTDSLRLIGGVSLEKLKTPRNFRYAPIAADSRVNDHILPKAGVIWTPLDHTTVRAAYTESVGGASIDQSFQIEPTQVAGFNQAFRSLIPESIAGANTASEFTTYGLSVEHRFRTRTYLALEGNLMESRVNRDMGAFVLTDLGGPFIGSLRERLDFRESSLSISLHQLIKRSWALGVTYRVSRAELEDDYPDVTDAVAATTGFVARQKLSGTLHTMNIHGIYQHPNGFFAQFWGEWTGQQNGDSLGSLKDESFWHWNALAGYRFPSRRASITVGLRNITDQNYHLSPVNLYSEKPRDRTFYAQFSFQF